MRAPTSFRRDLWGPSHAQGGFSLIVALMMLLVIIILGISSSQMAINEERSARNNRDRQIAFQAAEAALKDAESEILVTSITGCPLRKVPAPGTGVQPGAGRNGSSPLVCFNEQAGVGFANVGGCSTGTLAGLCDSTVTPAYLSSSVDFYKDAMGTGNMNTVQYGLFSGNAFPSTTSAFPPRYIIERVFKNVVSTDVQGKYMFRVTAMGFGANPNAQVVLQSIVSTEN